jgi:serine/threonine protein kinase
MVRENADGTTLSQSVHVNPTKDTKGGGEDSNGTGADRRNSGSGAQTGDAPKNEPLVLKVTSVHSRSQRDIAEKEAKLLSRLSHPSIVKMYDTCYRTVAGSSSSGKKGKDPHANSKERPQHLILMEYCEGGHALDVCSKLAAQGQRFDLSTLIIAFGQICNAVSYLHAQRPPIVHRDLKPANFLVKNGAYKLCDFGSAVFGHVDLRTPRARAESEEVIQKTTTQMFRSPEMVDLYMAKKLTQA